MIGPQSDPERGVIGVVPGDLTPLRIDEALVAKMLISFLRDETRKTGHRRLVLGVSGGVDSAVVAALAAAALGPENVLGLFTPYRTTFAPFVFNFVSIPYLPKHTVNIF